MTQQEKTIKDLVRVVLRLSEDMDYLLGRVHEFGPNTKGNQPHVARRVVALRAAVETLRSTSDLKKPIRKGA